MTQSVGNSKSREAIRPAGLDPQEGNLETPVNSSPLVKWFIGNLPAYRPGLNPFRRGLEIGMAHGYLLFGPFHRLGPLRSADNATLAGLLGSIGLVVILTACLSMYANSNPDKALASVTVPNPPVDAFNSRESWNNFASAFLIGGIGGAVVAFFLTINSGFIQGLIG
ncbi:MAG: photosystem I reaction center protein subunit XI [Sphaerospermopsis sp. SIO1G2]|nr:photosystem I reaction center protein subunit XI [Sphaerospermopsis sp. SIO1G1]NET71022.1 photosystem I reaction center protein subunit XI [Sphaerospermopsis sp. SIO1G2]